MFDFVTVYFVPVLIYHWSLASLFFIVAHKLAQDSIDFCEIFTETNLRPNEHNNWWYRIRKSINESHEPHRTKKKHFIGHQIDSRINYCGYVTLLRFFHSLSLSVLLLIVNFGVIPMRFIRKSFPEWLKFAKNSVLVLCSLYSLSVSLAPCSDIASVNTLRKYAPLII